MYEDLSEVLKTINFDESIKLEVLRVAEISTRINRASEEDIKCIESFQSNFNNDALYELRALIK